MIWHIFRKDLRVLWPMAALVALMQCLTAALLASRGQFERGVIESSHYGWLSNIALPVLCLSGLVILTIAVIQQDRLPGTTQDWLTRPIRRRDLFAAKLLFILIMGLGPVFVCDVVSGLIEHLPVRDVIAASLTRTFVLYGLVCLPALIIGIVTRSLTEALVFTLGIVLVLGIGMLVLAQTAPQTPVADSGFSWAIVLALWIANVIAVMLLLPLQLHWRGTNRVRWIAAAYLCAIPAVTFLPWSAGFGLQQVVAGHSEQPAFSVVTDTTRKVTFAYPKSARPDDGARPGFVTLTVPVRVAPGAKDQAWQLDYARIELIDPATGRSLGSARAQLSGDQMLLQHRDEHFEALVVPLRSELFDAVRSRHARMTATLFITTFRLQTRKPLSQFRGAPLDDFSRCGRGYGDVNRCVSTRPVGTCVDIEDPKGVNRRLRPGYSCRNTPYAPWPLPLWRDPYYTFDTSGWEPGTRAVATTGEDQRSKDLRMLRNYAPDAHFRRSVEAEPGDAMEQAVQAEPNSRDGVGSAARFSSPVGMAADSHGNMFIVDQTDAIVRKVSTSGEVTTFAGRPGQTGRTDGQGRDARFDHPRGIAVDAADNLYVADSGNAAIRKISPAGAVTTIAGSTGSASVDGSLRLNHPTDVAWTHDGSLYVIDHTEDGFAVLRQVLPNGVVKAVAGSDD